MGGVSAELRGRWLVAHESSGYEEWGASDSVRIDPDESRRGLSITLAPTVGAGTRRVPAQAGVNFHSTLTTTWTSSARHSQGGSRDGRRQGGRSDRWAANPARLDIAAIRANETMLRAVVAFVGRSG